MNCSSCGHENPTDSRFCFECGSAFAIRCGQCAAELPAGAKFCNRCGAPTAGSAPGPSERDPRAYTPKHLADKILQSKSALEGERKQVTVLFADVKGSMELAEQVDPEEWHRILDGFFEILADGVHRFEGTINQYTGDGIMALFGAPIAHEDHAQRACYAALHLREELQRYGDELRVGQGLSFGVRLGLNSGEVVVGKIGDDLRMDYTAQGATVGLAHRMQQIADSGRVYLTGDTADLVEGYFRLRDLGLCSVKGVSHPVPVYELDDATNLHTRLDVARARGLSRFVGREKEMAILEAALERAIEGSGGTVGVVGEAGVGKSRLCLEFAQLCQAKGILVYEAQCPAHAKTLPFLPLRQLLRSLLGVGDAEGGHGARRKIAGELSLLDVRFQDFLPFVFDFLGVADPERPLPPMEPEARERRLVGFLHGLIREKGTRERLVILVDDLHWIDPASDAFLARIADATSATAALLLVNFRPEYQASWQKSPAYQQLALVPLAHSATRELLRELLGEDASVAQLSERVGERTAGNPFFVEEVVRSLAETGHLVGSRGAFRLAAPVAEIEIPGTVQSVLAARIDRLPAPEKLVLQTAAVIGREFGAPLLEQCVSDVSKTELATALASLEQMEFVLTTSLYPDAEYAFKHPLTQEVAYASQLSEPRRRRHRAVAEALERCSAEALDTRAALVADHWEAASDILRSAVWRRRAAEAVVVRSTAEALRHWRALRSLLDRLPDSSEAMDLRLRSCIHVTWLGAWMGISKEEIAHLYEEGRRLACEGDDRSALARLETGHATFLQTQATFRESLEHTQRALELAAAPSDDEVRVQALWSQVRALWWLGHQPEANALAEEGIALTRETPTLGAANGRGPFFFFSLFHGLWVLFTEGAVPGRRIFDPAIGRAEALGDMGDLQFLCGGAAQGLASIGDAESALAYAGRAMAVPEQLGTLLGRIDALSGLGWAKLSSGHWDEGIAALEQMVSLSRKSNVGREYEVSALPWLSRGYLGRGEAARARDTALEALRLCRKRDIPMIVPLAELSLARARLALGVKREKQAIQSGLARAEAMSPPALMSWVREAEADLASALGDKATCVAKLREARGLFIEMGATGHGERVGRKLVEGGR